MRELTVILHIAWFCIPLCSAPLFSITCLLRLRKYSDRSAFYKPLLRKPWMCSENPQIYVFTPKTLLNSALFGHIISSPLNLACWVQSSLY